jgi:hypothetical protein
MMAVLVHAHSIIYTSVILTLSKWYQPNISDVFGCLETKICQIFLSILNFNYCQSHKL